MTPLIQRELFQLLIMFYCGLALMLLFYGRDRLLKRFEKKKRISVMIYFGGWICAGFLFYQFLYRASYGVITVYGMAAMCAGIFLWKKVIYGILKEK